MNRRKKIKTILKKRNKQANSKKDTEVNPSKVKPRYISKAERTTQEEQKTAEQSPPNMTETTESD
jgi:hypothetical protein